MKDRALGLVSCAAFVSLVGTAAMAEAAPERVRLRFLAAGDCPSENAFRNEVLEQTRELEFENDHTTRELEITAGNAAHGAWGELRLHRPGEQGTSRRVEDVSCSGVVSALALIAVLAVDPRAALTDAPSAEETVAPVARPALESPAEEDRSDDRGRRLGLAGSVSGEVMTPESPTITAAIAIAAELVLKTEPQLALRLGGRWGTSPQIARGPGEAQFRMVAISLELSPARLRLGPIGASAWAGVEYGALAAEGVAKSGLARQGEGSAPWIALLQTARLTADVGSGFEAGLELGLIEPLRRDQFFFDQPATPVHAVPALGILTGLGAGYHFF